MSNHIWSSEEKIAALSRDEIGSELAQMVADKLEADNGARGIWFSHPEYCGHGLVYAEGEFCLMEVQDGRVEYSTNIKTWGEKDAFCQWLAGQSDYSLSGADDAVPELFAEDSYSLNNQRLTRQRMESYVAD